MKDYMYGILAMLILAALMFFAVLYCTSDEAWYAGKHDSKCEKLAGKADCGCYNRFMKKAKERK